ncbi:zinc finger and BTB domain-containing protein 7C [Bombina bombina]|uniref:zinc finger and BTB domain-containing protein 7C n=1 Tax=Bombina bombina TaxID=8345 RepID=UPI00235ADA17|nr:zinc finger and BTB domain-containing protein 7C [Bombina bombina]XP_053557067.1 zinc finger and BTB domain-containing protein 7C [Bombina bombina]XP_053557069.1 zinc finger and BTB domain-containing protein 7C [Bombina bombina]XP_053557070.1 zinc finger and BTB domain-containing protein 7C [Bombina bombina]
MMAGDNDLIGIPFPNHSSEVLSGLNEQRHHGLLCDVILIIQEQEYRTHKSVLAACSKYFKKLFTAGSLIDQPYIYEIDFVKPEAFSAILEFAYTSTLTITTSNVKLILDAAEMLEIQCIINVCLEILETPRDGEEDNENEENYDDEEEEDDGGEVEEDTKIVINQENQAEVQEANCDQSPPTSNNSEETYHESQKDLPTHFSSTTNSSGHQNVLKDFSIESLLSENLYPKNNTSDRRPAISHFVPGFFPQLWNSDFGSFSQLQEQDADNSPLDLVIKNRKIKEEEHDELPTTPFSNEYFKEMFLDHPPNHFGQIKAEMDYSAYLSFLSAAHLGMLPPWPLEEERKIKPKASQQCPICHKVIMGAGKLPRHMRTHTGEKPYMCSICEVRFTRQDKLKIHMRKHTGERPYLCIHCNAKFVHNYDLKNHMRIHTGVRPYQCEFCYKSFTRSDHLHRHIKRQSCRMSRPRRGRKPAAWRTASLLFSHNNDQEDKNFMMIPPTLDDRSNHLTSGTIGVPDPSSKHLLEDARSVMDFQALEKQFEESQIKMLERARLEAERHGGLFPYALTHNENLSPRQFFSGGDPWNITLNHTTISETSN